MAKIKGSYFKDSFIASTSDGHTRISFGAKSSGSGTYFNQGSWSSAKKVDFDTNLSQSNIDNRSELDSNGNFEPHHTGIYHSTVSIQLYDACYSGRISGSTIALRNLTAGDTEGYEKLIGCNNQPYIVNNNVFHEEQAHYNTSFLHKFLAGQKYAIYVAANNAGSNSNGCIRTSFNSAYNINMWSIVWVGGA